jgi:hypothetical protein
MNLNVSGLSKKLMVFITTRPILHTLVILRNTKLKSLAEFHKR